VQVKTGLEERLAGWFARRMSAPVADIRVEGLERPKAGWSSETILFDLVCARPGGTDRFPLVAKLEPPAPAVFPDTGLRLQYAVMDALGPTQVPVPTVRGFEDDPGVLGAAFFVMDRLPGQAATDTYHSAGWLADLDAAGRRRVWDAGIDLVATVNRVDVDDIMAAVPDLAPPAGVSPLAARLTDYATMLTWAESLGRPHPFARDALAWLEAHQPSAIEPAGLCWGDARIGNILYAGDGATEVTAALDWEMVHVGNPVHDLAWYVTLDRCLSEGAGIERLAGLPSRDATADRWQSQTGLPIDDLAYYEILSAFEFAVILLRVMTLYKDTGTFPVDSDYDIDNLATATLARLLDEWSA
jgi:aminoglycoside phosphotransferase (APT) family kinase protein